MPPRCVAGPHNHCHDLSSKTIDRQLPSVLGIALLGNAHTLLNDFDRETITGLLRNLHKCVKALNGVLWVFHVLPVHHQSFRLSQPNKFAHRHFARIHHAASDLLLVTCKWRYCCRFWTLHGVSGVPIGALLSVLQQWLLVASVCRTLLVS